MTSRPHTPRLGRGLVSLMGDAGRDQQDLDAAVQLIHASKLRPGPFQPRVAMSTENLENLAESIKANGILQPILVRADPEEQDVWQIVAGERRWRAAQMAGQNDIPCLVRSFSDSDAMAAGLVENLQRQDLNPIEEAQGYQRLLGEFGLRQEDVAQVIGKSRAHVANTLRLLTLPEPVLTEVRRGALSAGHARALVVHPNPEAAAVHVIARGLNVRQTEALTQSNRGKSAVAHEKDANTAALEELLANHLGLSVTIQQNATRGQLRIAFSNLDQLDGLVRLLMPNQ